MKDFSNNLRGYQIEALKVCQGYIRSKSKGNCLIKLPTGTGKTGIIAMIVNQYDEGVLIIVPNASLPLQTHDEITVSFWNNIGLKPEVVKEAMIIDNKNLKKLDKDKKLNYIITIQTLLSIYENDKSNFDLIKDCISLIIYDEGHREPALIWSEANRDLDKKTILFTATPYRNDNFVFNINERFVFKYPMREAIEAGNVKRPEFIRIPYYDSNAEIISFIEGEIGEKKLQTLIRCESSTKISTFVEELNKKGIPTLGCHSDFKNTAHLFDNGKKVLEIEKDYSVIVHCDMLIEGINVPRLNSLMLLDGFANMKSTIQQIGRVLRPSSALAAYIYVHEDTYDEICSQWQMYLDSEDNEDDFTYVDGKFRPKFVLDATDKVYENILFEKQAIIYQSNKSLFRALQLSIVEHLNKVGNLTKYKEGYFKSGGLWILCYVRREPSKILRSEYFFNYSLEFFSLVELKHMNTFFYFYYNSRRLSLPFDSDDLKLIDRESIIRLIPTDSEIKNVKYTSTSISKIGARTKSIDGSLLNKIPGSLSERISFCRNVTGYCDINNEKTFRYVSAMTSKISERKECNYEEYIDWCNQIIVESCSVSSSRFFSRFANVTNFPNSTPSSILLDLDITIMKDGKTIHFDSQYCIIDNMRFTFSQHGNLFTGVIVMNAKEETVSLYIQEFADYLVTESEIGLQKHFERNNYFLFFAESQVMYYNKIFFKPNLEFKYNHIDEFDMWNDIVSISTLNNAENEKMGANPTQSFNTSISWPLDSVFGSLINELKTNPQYSNIDYVICDDLGYEIADFIALSSTTNCIYFIHCKYGDNKLSASTFHDVCSQAVKNLEYVYSSNPDLLRYFGEHFSRWKEKWTIAGHSADRIVKGTHKSLLKEYKRILENPNARKEVWLVTTGLSRKALKQELLKKKDQVEQFQQLMFLLRGTQDSVSQAGAYLKIFCKE